MLTKFVSLLWSLFMLTSCVAQHPCDIVPGTFDSWMQGATSIDVVVVGGGASGLSAMKQFQGGKRKVNSVVLLEAQDYLGGRVKTVRTSIEATGKTVLTEDGAEWVHGGRTTDLYRLAKKLNGLAPDTKTWNIFFNRNNGAKASPLGYNIRRNLMKQCETKKIITPYFQKPDKGFGQCFIDRFDQTYKKLKAPAAEKEAWYFYNEQMVNKDQGTDTWLNISARDALNFRGADQWDQWKNGYDTLINYITKSIENSKLKLNSPVCRIHWDNESTDRVLVVTKDGTSYLAKHVLITVSIGYLKEHRELFTPELPTTYTKLLEDVHLGVADKIQLGWDKPWWGNKYLDLTMIWTEKNLPAEQEWLYGIMEFLSIHQYPEMIQAFITGKYAKLMEDLPEETVKSDIMQLLNSVMSKTLQKKGLSAVPEPIFFRRTTWGLHEWSYGSYNSYVSPVGADNGLKTRQPLAKSVKNSYNKQVLIWGGEALSTTRYGAVDGAMAVGKTMAIKIKNLLA
ncbi:hypothetical protein SK128_019369 [Halocaridina rubra]|uniref:Amine oxidase n=1 Tax=Halocaridina rubra TaxID=373956 RepID=A0AAN8XM30_HALRR